MNIARENVFVDFCGGDENSLTNFPRSRVFLEFSLSSQSLTNRKSRKKPERCIKISAAYNLGRKIIFNILMHVSDAMMRQSYSLDMNPFIFSSDFRQTFKFSPRGIVTRRGGSEG